MYGEALAIKNQVQLMCRAPELAVTHFLFLHVIFPKVERGAEGFPAAHDYQEAAKRVARAACYVVPPYRACLLFFPAKCLHPCGHIAIL